MSSTFTSSWLRDHREELVGLGAEDTWLGQGKLWWSEAAAPCGRKHHPGTRRVRPGEGGMDSARTARRNATSDPVKATHFSSPRLLLTQNELVSRCPFKELSWAISQGQHLSEQPGCPNSTENKADLNMCQLKGKHEPSVSVPSSSFASLANIKQCRKDPEKLWKWVLTLKSEYN